MGQSWSAIGNQYINEGKVLRLQCREGRGFFYEMLAAQPRGTFDRADRTDHIINPNAIQRHLPAGLNGNEFAKIATSGKDGWRHAGVTGDGGRNARAPHF